MNIRRRLLSSFQGSGESSWIRLGLAVAAIAAYILAFIPPFVPEEYRIVELAATPIVVCAWLFGFWGGTAAAIVIIPFNAFLFSLVTGEPFASVIRSQDELLPAVLLVVLGAVLGGLRDIAEQMRQEFLARTEVEEARRESEERYRFVAESASDGIITIDQDRTILFANRAAEKIFGLSITDMVGRPFRMLIPERVRAEHDDALGQYLDTVVTSSPEFALQIAGLGRGDREIALEISFGEYVKDHEHIFTGVVRDVTERKKLEHVLTRAKEDAERASRAKSEFLSRMSHELRTPMNAILGFAQVLEMDDLEQEQRENVDQILKAGIHLLGLVDEVLDIAHIESGRISLELEPVAVDGVSREAWELVRHRAEQSGIRLVNGDLEGCDARVTADRRRLKQILVNLLSNAVKYNVPSGEVRVRCERGQTAADRLRVSVSDTGRGIPEEARDSLFTPFERLGQDRSDVEGTGIGLAVCRGLVEAMGGQIGVESEEDRGSTFWFELPLAASQEVEEAPEGAVATRDRPNPEPTVLYVEDSPSNIRLIEQVFRKQRPALELRTATGGEQALERIRTEEPGLVLLDIHLPDIDGYEVMRRIKADPTTAEIPVIAISADVTAETRQRLTAEGARTFVEKPIDFDVLLRAVDDALGG
jgi:PAS domain S-box-containing protein